MEAARDTSLLVVFSGGASCFAGEELRALLVTVYGAAESAWSETIEHRSGVGRGTRTSFETLDFRGGEVFLNQQVCLLGAAMGAAIIPIRPGTHHYSFAFRMPTNLPASFEASHGYVRFKVMAVLDASDGQYKESSSEFTVFNSDDLRLDPTLRIPKSFAESKRFRSLSRFFFKSDPAITTVTLQQTGFVPGQIVPVEIVHKNASSNDIRATKVSIWRHILFNGDIPQSGTKLECELIVEGQTGGCRRGDEKLYQCNLTLPSTLLKSNHEICRVVQVSYELAVESIIGCSGSKNINVLMPIKIGSIPLDFIAPLPTQQIDEIQAAYLSAAEDLPPTFDEAIAETGRMPIQHQGFDDQNENDQLPTFDDTMNMRNQLLPEQTENCSSIISAKESEASGCAAVSDTFAENL